MHAIRERKDCLTMKLRSPEQSPGKNYAAAYGCTLAFAIAVGVFTADSLFHAQHAQAQSKKQTALSVVAVVNDEPITAYDVKQRSSLLKILGGQRGSTASLRKAALEELIDDAIKRQEAKRLKVAISKKQIDATILRMAKSTNATPASLKARLGRAGVQFGTLSKQIESQLAWNGAIRQRYSRRVKVDEADVDRRYEQAKKNPGETQKFFILQQIILPYEKGASRELVYSRVVEAQTLAKRFKGCKSTRKAANGIFNVRIRDIGTVPRKTLPAKLRNILLKVGPGRVTKPNVTPSGVELIAYCSNKVIKPDPITRETVKDQMLNERYFQYAQRYLRDLKRDALVEKR